MCGSYALHIPNGEKKRILNVFDFDNTLFRSPKPNPKLWDSTLIGSLTAFQQINNGWWHDLRSLQLGEEVEEMGWNDFWIEPIVTKVRQSMDDPQSFTVLLTGRVKDIFEDKIISMVTSKGLVFDLIILKSSINYEAVRLTNEESQPTTAFKERAIEDIIDQNPSIEEVYMWEDRPGHVSKFRTVIAKMIASGKIENGLVIQVTEPPSYMSESVEKSRVFEMVNEHNDYVDRWLKITCNMRLPPGVQAPKKLELKNYVKYTGVFFSQEYTDFLLGQFLPPFTNDVDTSGWTISGDHITMCLQKCPQSMLDECGGLGASVFVKILAVGQYKNRIWAFKVGEASMSDISTGCLINPPTYNQANIGRLVSYILTPHITMAYDQTQGAKAQESNLITEWQILPTHKQYILQGVVKEYRITGVKKPAPPPPPSKAAVSIGALIKQYRPEVKGPEIGRLVKFVHNRMAETNIINSVDNTQEITSLIITAPPVGRI